MKKKTKIIIKTSGYIVIFVGLYKLIVNIIFPQHTELQTFLNLYSNSIISLTYESIINIVKVTILLLNILFILMHILVGFFLIKMKSIGRYLAIVLCWMYLFAIFLFFAIEGLVYYELYFGYSSFLIISLMIILHKRQFTDALPCKKSPKVISIILGCILFIIISIYSYVIIKIHLNSPGFEIVNYQKVEHDDNEEIVTFDFPPNFSIDFPINKYKLFFLFTSNSNPMISIFNPVDSITVMLDDNSFHHSIYKQIYPDSTITELELSKKLVKEKFGLFFLLLSGRTFDIYPFDEEFKNFKLNGFEITYHHSGNLGEYNLFRKEDEKGSVTFIKMNSDEGSRKVKYNYESISKIISSIKPLDDNPKTAMDYFNKGLEYYNDGNYRRALLEFIPSSILDNSNPKIKFYIAKTTIKTKNFFSRERSKWSKAEYALEELLEVDPNNIEATELYKIVQDRLYQIDQKDLIEKFKDLSESITYNPNLNDLKVRAKLYEENGRIQEALDDYYQITKLSGIKSREISDAYFKIASIHLDLRNIDEAEKILRIVLLDTTLNAKVYKFSKLYDRITEFYLQKDKPELAKNVLNKAISTAPTNDRFIEARAREFCSIAKYYITQNKLEQAELILNESIAKGSVLGTTYYYQGEIHSKKDEYFDAVKLWIKAYKNKYRTKTNSLKLSLFFLQINQKKIAKKFFISSISKKTIKKGFNPEYIQKYNFSTIDEKLLLDLMKEIFNKRKIPDYKHRDVLKELEGIDFSQFRTIKDIRDYFESR